MGVLYRITTSPEQNPMKHHVIRFFVIVFVLNYSCKQKSITPDIREQILSSNKKNEELNNKLDSIIRNYVVPFQEYEKVVMQEKDTNPDSLINMYLKIINKYPNSFWKHESERRIKNIKKRKSYWTKDRGWQLDIPKKPSEDESIISCPGC